jgi:hypothetical protein
MCFIASHPHSEEIHHVTANWTSRLTVLVLFLSTFSILSAQNISGMTGVITDSSGAVLPGTVVTLTNPQTGLSFTQTTNSEGAYRFSNVPPSAGYKATFTHVGFAPVRVDDLTLAVGTTRTQNEKLVAGSTQEVEVSAGNQEVTLNTTDATIGNNFDVKMVNELPIQDRSQGIQVLFGLQPGVNSSGSVTGARSDQNSVTLDGMDINDIAAGQAQTTAITGSTFNTVGGAPPDAIQEFRGTVAGLPEQTSTGSGGQFQLVTKSGTNKFHGDLNEYHRDNSTTANTWANNNSVPKVALPKLIRNQFGGAIGGPITIPRLYSGRDKLFFFFDFNNGRTIQQQSTTRTVPLDSFRNGVIGYINSGTGCGSSSRRTNAAQCITDLTSAQAVAQGFDPLNLGFDAPLLAYVNSRYPHANDLSLGDGVNTGGYRFNQSTNQTLYNYVGRVDYNISSKQRVFLQYHTIRSTGVQSFNEFDTDPLTYPNQNLSYGYVGSHIWNIGNNKVNQFYYGDNVQIAKFPVNFSPTGISSFSFGGLSAPNGSLSAQNRRIPIPEFRDDFNWTKGTHTLAFGGTFKFIKTNSRLTNDYEFVGVGLGGLTPSLDSSMRPSDLNSASAAVSRYDSLFAFALGRIATESRNYNYTNTGAALAPGTGAVRRYRYFQTEAYVGDTWKATPSMTLTYGLRYQYYSVPFEANGTQSNVNLGFDEYLAARVAQSAGGTTGNTAVPFLTYNLGGKANSAGDIYNPSWKDLAPRFGFAYNPEYSRKTVINGAFGLDFDRTVVNAINFVQDQLSYLFQNSQSKSYGQTVARTAFATDPRLGANLTYPAVPGPAPLAKPYTPYVTSAGVPTGIVNGQVNYAVDKNLKTPYSISFNLGVQRQLPGSFIVSGSYVGRLGRRLIGQADASQLLDFQDKTSGQFMSQAFANFSAYIRANPNSTKTLAGLNAIPAQAWFENQMSTNLGYATKTAALAAYTGASLGAIGDFADTIQFLQGNGLIGKNIGLPAQFAADTYITNKGYAAYHGALLTVTKNASHGLQFQFNYTFSHSTDNVSAVSNYIGINTGTGQVCDALVRSSCYGNSDFDVKHNITSTFVYELPVGRGRAFGGNMNRMVDLVVGGWSISGIPTYRSGFAFSTSTGAFLAGYANNIPGTFNGDRSAVKVRLHKDPATGILQLFDDPIKAAAAFSDPLGFQYGSRNNLRGPSAVTFDAGLAKRFQIVPEKLTFQLRGDGFNVLNHPIFATPSTTNINSGVTFGQITPPASNNRVIQVSGRLEF